MAADPKPDAGQTTFDALIEGMKREIDINDVAEERPHHVARLRSIFEAALHEAEDKGDEALELVKSETGKIREQMKAQPMATISGAFAVGYLVGRTIAGRSRR